MAVGLVEKKKTQVMLQVLSEKPSAFIFSM